MCTGVSRESAANGFQVLRGRLRWYRATGSQQEVPATCRFQRSGYFFLYLVGYAVLERCFLADAAHYGFAGTLLALTEVRVALQVGCPVYGVNRVGCQQIEVDARSAHVQDVELASAFNCIEKFQVVLLAKFAILVSSQEAFRSPAVGGVEDAARALFQAGNGVACEGFGNHAQRGVHGIAVFAD